jgi:hypothetical protein
MKAQISHAAQTLQGCLWVSLGWLVFTSSWAPQADEFGQEVRPFIERHCFDCHDTESQSGGIDLEHFADSASALAARGTWLRIQAVLRSGEMPPEKVRRRPSAIELKAVERWIEASFGGDLEQPEPVELEPAGQLRRLNRFEYQNALLDLLGVDFAAVNILPADPVVVGFDVIGDSLSLPPLLFEKLFQAAEDVALQALPPQSSDGFVGQRWDLAQFKTPGSNRYVKKDKLIAMTSGGASEVRTRFAKPGRYLLRVKAGARQAGPELARLQVKVGRTSANFEVQALVSNPKWYERVIHVKAGRAKVSVAFTNDYYQPDDPDPAQRDRNLYVFGLELVGPLDQPGETEFEARFWPTGSEPKDLPRALSDLAHLIWRQPLGAAEVRELLALSPPELGAGQRLRCALTALLVSPRFLFRSGSEATLLAERTAAFLWSSVPDMELLTELSSGGWKSPLARRRIIERMLKDARSTRLSKSFATQWLQLGRLSTVSPDPERFPAFDAELGQAMLAESQLFFDAILREGRPISDLLRADFSFVNAPLAKLYGIAGIHGLAMQRVSIPYSLRAQRGGILGQAALATSTSTPTRTSPVLRGKWVLEALLATPPAPPPPGVDALVEDQAVKSTHSVREQLAMHRERAACAVCHDPMDGLGFAMENYDGIGRWRSTDLGQAVDATGELPGGISMQGPLGLGQHLAQNKAFLRGLATHLLVFALGRALDDRDEAELEGLVAGLSLESSLQELVQRIVALDAFAR